MKKIMMFWMIMALTLFANSSSSTSSSSITCPVGYTVRTICDSYSYSGIIPGPGSCTSSHQECYNPCVAGYFYNTPNTCTLSGNAPSSTDVKVCPSDSNNNTPTPDFANRCCPSYNYTLPASFSVNSISRSSGHGTIYYGLEQFPACSTSSSSSAGAIMPGDTSSSSSYSSSGGNLPDPNGGLSSSSSSTSDIPPLPGGIPSITVTKSLNLSTGWNLISVPMQTETEFNLNLLLSGKATIAYKFNTDSYTWDRWLDGTANITLKNGEGVFVGVPSGTPSLSFEALTSTNSVRFEDTNYQTKKWYLLGFGYDITVSSIKALYPSSVIWIMENGAYKKLPDNATVIPAGQGFWFKNNQ